MCKHAVCETQGSAYHATPPTVRLGVQLSEQQGRQQELERVIKQRDTALQYGLAAEAELQEVEQKLHSTFEHAQACSALLPIVQSQLLRSDPLSPT